MGRFGRPLIPPPPPFLHPFCLKLCHNEELSIKCVAWENSGHLAIATAGFPAKRALKYHTVITCFYAGLARASDSLKQDSLAALSHGDTRHKWPLHKWPYKSFMTSRNVGRFKSFYNSCWNEVDEVISKNNFVHETTQERIEKIVQSRLNLKGWEWRWFLRKVRDLKLIKKDFHPKMWNTLSFFPPFSHGDRIPSC